ncbi:cation transporter [Thiomicrospira microaerophila]|uniref:cation diffusion facilitator family transporter n=1 Tax=Thiomicrospira microaerophila TaxID=406020 RepID=UPI00200E3441|nr:cation transporter [Thiomicrospira microaerophila]UQB41271.1 cation transporter [Thiomicrospira microaerophila]
MSSHQVLLNKLEKRALDFSVWGNVFMVVIGVGFAIVSASDAIMLDGLYSFIHLLIALLTLRVSRLVMKPSNDDYPFGYWMYEPMINLAKGLMIITLLALALFNAFSALYSGGTEVVLGMAVFYAVLATVGCFVSGWFVGSLGKRAHSPLALVDAKNWLVDGYISAAMLGVFLAAYFVQDTDWAHWVPYFDPIMVIVLVAFIVIVPLSIMRDAWNEIVGKHPGDDIEDKIRDLIDSVISSALHKGYRLRLVMTGRFLLVHIYFKIEADSPLDSIEALDDVREQLYQAFRKHYPFVAMDVVFTQQDKWQKIATGESEATG